MAGLLAVMLAACSSGTSAAPSAAPSIEPTSQPTPTTAATLAPTPLPAPTSPAPGLSVKVTFDGETCTYVGPTVIPDGTVVRFEFAPDQQVAADSHLLIYGVEPGITFQDLLDHGERYGLQNVDANIPEWIYQETYKVTYGASTMLYTIESVKRGSDGIDHEVGGYQILCYTPVVFPAVQLSVAGL